jgi:uncharacterized protein (DUF305 family)
MTSPDTGVTEAPDEDLPEVGDAEGDDELPWWGVRISWLRLVALLAVVAFFSGAVVYALTGPSHPSASGVDVGFLRDMRFHHLQAVQMAEIEEQNGSDEVVISYAAEIIREQSYEVGLMTATLQRYGDDPDVGRTVMGWMGPALPRDQMPGLATPAQLDQLRNAKGAAADRLFFELMAAHHAGGIHMATFAYHEAKLAYVRQLAQKIAWNQAIEINEFRQVSRERGIGATITAAPPTVPDPLG